MMRVQEVMTEGVKVASPDLPLKDAAQKMEAADAGVLPVCEDGKLVGIVTDRDITVRGTAEGKDPAKVPVRDIMTKDVLYCSGDQDVKEAAKIMEEHKVRRLPVLDAEMRLAGIVSISDIARTQDRKLAGEVLQHVSTPGPG